MPRHRLKRSLGADHLRTMESLQDIILERKRVNSGFADTEAMLGFYGGEHKKKRWKLRRDKRDMRNIWNKKTFRPHVMWKYVKSDILGMRMKVKMTLSVLRQIDEHDSDVDQYLLRSSDETLGSAFAIKLKREIIIKLLRADRDAREALAKAKADPASSPETIQELLETAVEAATAKRRCDPVSPHPDTLPVPKRPNMTIVSDPAHPFSQGKGEYRFFPFN
eukprot:67763_1